VSERASEKDETTDHLYAAHPRVFLCDEICDYNSCDPTINSVITSQLLAACLSALGSFTQVQDGKKEHDPEQDDNQKINELSRTQISV
jgi:hypothetical protein